MMHMNGNDGNRMSIQSRTGSATDMKYGTPKQITLKLAFNPTSTAQNALPCDEDLYTALKELLQTADLMTVTKKQLRDALSLRFGCDLTGKKAVVNEMINDILAG